jgi:glycerophosphoryl diester phosphodiesterase
MAEAPAWLTARPIAHRGLHDRAAGIPENTLAAADAAIAGGFGIECDVQLSADGEPMVFHDFALGRLTEATEAVRERRSADLAALAVAGTAERIPTLGALLARVAGRVPLIVEIKSRFDGDLAPSERTAAAVAGYTGPLALKSFDPDVVAALIRLAPDRPRGIIAESDTSKPDYASLSPERRRALAHLLHMDESRPDFLSWRVADLPCAATYLCRRLAGMPVMTWTVRTPEDRERAAAHADQMVFEGFRPD